MPLESTAVREQMITEHVGRARAAGETGDAAGRRVRDPGVRQNWAGPAGRATQPHAERGRRPNWAGPRGGRNSGRGGAAGPGPRSTLGRARWARNTAARQTWAEAAEKKGSSPRSGQTPPPAPSGGPPPGYASWRRSGACHPRWSTEETGYRWRKWRGSGRSNCQRRGADDRVHSRQPPRRSGPAQPAQRPTRQTTTPTTTDEEVQALAQEVAELQGMRHSCRGAVQRAILRGGLRQFTRGEQGIRSLCGSLRAVIRRGLDDDEEEGYYSSSEDESEVTEDTARRGLGEAGLVTVAASIWNRCVPSDLLGKYRRHLRRERVADSGRGRRAKVLGCMFEDIRVTTRGSDARGGGPPPRPS